MFLECLILSQKLIPVCLRTVKDLLLSLNVAKHPLPWPLDVLRLV